MLGFSKLNWPSKGPVNLGRTLRINQPISDVLGQLLAITLGWITPPPPADSEIVCEIAVPLVGDKNYQRGGGGGGLRYVS